MDNGSILYRRYLDGDDEAMVELIKCFKDGLILYINGITSNLSLAEAYPLCTTHPAALLGEPAFSNGDEHDFLAVGKQADFLIFRHEPSRLGPMGISDSDNLRVGRFHFEAIVRAGKDRCRNRNGKGIQ